MSYLKEHFNGKLSLAKSFWAGMIAVAVSYIVLLVMGFVAFYLLTLFANTDTMLSFCQASKFILFASLLSVYPLLAWFTIGLWRSSRQHALKSPFWARISQLCCIIVAAFSLYTILFYNGHLTLTNHFFNETCNAEFFLEHQPTRWQSAQD